MSSQFKDIWHSALFNVTFFDAFNATCDEDDVSANKAFIKILRLCLSKLHCVEENCEPWLLEEVLNPALNVLRGLLAPLCPIPLLYGARVAHVKYVNPDAGGGSLLSRQVTKVGQLFMNKLKNSRICVVRRASYMKVAHSMLCDGETLLDVYQQSWNIDLSIPEDSLSVVNLVKICSQDARLQSKWKKHV